LGARNRFGMPKSTLLDELNGGHGGQIRWPTVLTRMKRHIVGTHLVVDHLRGFPFLA
jgi:hypothetical protein